MTRRRQACERDCEGHTWVYKGFPIRMKSPRWMSSLVLEGKCFIPLLSTKHQLRCNLQLKLIFKLYLCNGAANEVRNHNRPFPIGSFIKKFPSWPPEPTNSLTKQHSKYDIFCTVSTGAARKIGSTQISRASHLHFVSSPLPHPLGLSVGLRFQQFFPEMRWGGGGQFYNIGHLSIKLVLRVLILFHVVLEEGCAKNNKFRQCW